MGMLVLAVGATTLVTVPASARDTAPLVDRAPADQSAAAEHPPSDAELVRPSLRHELAGERFYFVLPDRFANGNTANDTGGIGGGRLEHGSDPTDKAFFHGGDLAGVLDKMDYIEELGTTAIWMAPVFANKPVQGLGTPFISAGYHGYWTLDYTRIDPHFGTNAELTAVIDEAHARGIKVFFDIITNHTADVISYAEGVYDYVSKAEAPYRDAAGTPFDDRAFAGTGSFPALDANTSFPYTPVIAPSQPTKTPAWLNDPTLYHNRGGTTFTGEDSLYGDFFGLDDLFTEHPRVVQGMIDIFSDWVDFGVDGFRIDTTRHVDQEFWQQWAPAILERAHEIGNDDFFMFGEVFVPDPAYLSIFTTNAKLPAVLDFAFQAAAQDFAAESAPTRRLQELFVDDDLYIDADSNAYSLPTFLGNHDMGRIGMFVADANPGADDRELLARTRLAHSLMYVARGMPVIYSGDEQGFTGAGNDQLARQDMFPSQTPEYGDDDQIGSDETPRDDNFDADHPLYDTVAELSALADDHVALRDGAQLHRYAADEAGVYAFSRVNRTERVEYVVVANNAEGDRTASFDVGTPDATFTAVWPAGVPSVRSDAARRLEVAAAPLGLTVYRADRPLPRSGEAPEIAVGPSGRIDRDENGYSRHAELFTATLDRDTYAEVTFVTSDDGGPWTYAGTDDNAPYRIALDRIPGSEPSRRRVRAIVDDLDGHVDSATTGWGCPTEPACK